jgi:hypothetical protein
LCSDQLAEFHQGEIPGERIPEAATRLTSKPRDEAVPCEHCERLVAPQKLSKCRGIDFVVRSFRAYNPQKRQFLAARIGQQDAPPTRHTCFYLLHVPSAHNNRKRIEDLVVRVGLGWQTVEVVVVALDLKAFQQTVHNSHIRSNSTAANAQLVQYESSRIASEILS